MNRVLLDQGLPRSAALILRKIGWDIIHTGEVGMATASDQEILLFAEKENRVIVTLDADFHSILAVTNAEQPSVVRLRREGLKGPDLARMIEMVWENIEDALVDGAMVTVTETSIRMRSLPLFPTEINNH